MDNHKHLADSIRTLLRYDADSGAIYRAVDHGTRGRAGNLATGAGTRGYLRVKVCGRLFAAHRLAWFLHFGGWPTGQIDHINSNRSDNRIANLRDVSQSVNQQNIKRAKASSRSGLLGATKMGRKWLARIRVDGEERLIGKYETAEKAHAAYIEAKRCHHAGNTL